MPLPLVFKSKQLKCMKTFRKPFFHSPLMDFMKLSVIKHWEYYRYSLDKMRHSRVLTLTGRILSYFTNHRHSPNDLTMSHSCCYHWHQNCTWRLSCYSLQNPQYHPLVLSLSYMFTALFPFFRRISREQFPQYCSLFSKDDDPIFWWVTSLLIFPHTNSIGLKSGW